VTVYLIGWSESPFRYLSNGIKIILLGAIGPGFWAAEGTGTREFVQTLTIRISMTTWPEKEKKLATIFFHGTKHLCKISSKSESVMLGWIKILDDLTRNNPHTTFLFRCFCFLSWFSVSFVISVHHRSKK